MKKKKMNRWCLIGFAIIFCFANLSFALPIDKGRVSFAEDKLPKEFSVLAPNLYLNDILNGEKDDFTPMNLQTGMRFGKENGTKKSYVPLLNAEYEIGGFTYHYVDKTISMYLNDVDIAEENASLQFWMFVDEDKIRDFCIELVFEDDFFAKWQINYVNLLEKSEEIDDDSWGWFKVNLNFSDAVKNGEIFDALNGKFKTILKLKIYQIASDVNAQEVALRFYDMKIVENLEHTANIIVDKQAYVMYNFDFETFYSSLNENLFLGDSWLIPKINNAMANGVKTYFWYGTQNLIDELYVMLGDNESGKVKVGETITFGTNGNMNMYLCGKLSSEEIVKIPESAKALSIVSFVGLWFAFDSVSAKTGSSYELEFAINELFEEVENFEVVASNGNVEIESINRESGKIVVVAKDSGSANVTIKFVGTRNGIAKEYSKSVEFKISTTDESFNTLLLIVCLISLGLVLCFGTYYGIKIIKNANKYNVK